MVWIYIFISILVISLVSLIGIFTFSIKKDRIERFLIYFIALAAGTLLGDAFIHLVPEATEKASNPLGVSVPILVGIFTFLILEKFIHWRHCHKVACEEHPHPFSYSILAGDAVHNFIDGIIIAASFLVSVPVGIATTIAVVLHEVPQEIGDFGSLLYAGFSKGKALFFNFLTALTAFLGAILVFIVGQDVQNITNYLIPFAAGGFIYIASADLIPELKKQNETAKSLGQVFIFILGILLMFGLVLFE